MYGSLRGTVTAHLEQRLLIEVAGIGYWVHTGSWQPDGEISCYLYHHVREESSDLYGFNDLSTLHLFEKLLSVSGIGPKAALALLSIGTAEQVRNAIAEQDTTFLSRAPGVGLKAAQKIILELQNKLPSLTPSIHNDLFAALEGLGYKPAEIQTVISQVPPELTTVDTQIKWALQKL